MEFLRKRGKPIPVRFTLIRALSPGFSSAPYKNGKKQDADAKKIAELTTVVNEDGKSSPAIQMWSFKKMGGIGDKGPRNDGNTWTLGAGVFAVVVSAGHELLLLLVLLVMNCFCYWCCWE